MDGVCILIDDDLSANWLDPRPRRCEQGNELKRLCRSVFLPGQRHHTSAPELTIDAADLLKTL